MKRPLRSRVRCGGLVTWYSRGRVWCKVVTILGPPEWEGEAELFRQLQAKARKRWPKATIQEAWRE